MNNTNLISNLLGERSNFILIGLTGRTGSGCTTTSKLLSKELQLPYENEVNYKNEKYFNGMDTKRYGIVRNYAVKHNDPFKIIKVSELISASILNLDVNEFKSFIKSVIKNELHVHIDSVLEKSNFEKIQMEFKSLSKEIDYFLNGTSTLNHNLKELDINRWIGIVNEFTINLKDVLKTDLGNSYVQIYQGAGDSIRRTTKIISNYRGEPFDPQGLFVLPRMINRIIKFYRYKDKSEGKKTYVAIDTIRNPYEAKYFKDRYAAFYLVSINAPT